ncbi:hypothetical protein BVZ55_00996 [Haemophilus influenzae]|nr:hypothetical protein BVZ55_00996 [Haemophilus influenzae]
MLAVTFTVLPETVPSIVPVALVILASPDFASIFEPAWVVKPPVVATFTVLPEIVPPIVPVALVTLASPDFASIFESAVEVNLPLSAVIVTALPEMLLTVRVSPVAESVTEPELDSTLPLILPVLVVIFASPVVALIVESFVVVKAPELVVTVTF